MQLVKQFDSQNHLKIKSILVYHVGTPSTPSSLSNSLSNSLVSNMVQEDSNYKLMVQRCDSAELEIEKLKIALAEASFQNKQLLAKQRRYIDKNDLLIVKTIATGAFGKVSHAVWKGLHVCTKEFMKKGSFFEEFDQLVDMNFPHIVQTIGYSGTDDYCLVVEYMNKGALYNYVRANKLLCYNDIKRILLQVLSALQFVHIHKKAHLDIKTSNILLHGDNEINAKLGDFGTVQTSSNLSANIIGTMNYMAPEVLKCTDFCEKADIWSMGMVIYELMTRYYPHEGRSSEFLIQTKGEVVPQFDENKYYDPELVNITQKCWTLDQTARPSCYEVIKMVEAWVPQKPDLQIEFRPIN